MKKLEQLLEDRLTLVTKEDKWENLPGNRWPLI